MFSRTYILILFPYCPFCPICPLWVKCNLCTLSPGETGDQPSDVASSGLKIFKVGGILDSGLRVSEGKCLGNKFGGEDVKIIDGLLTIVLIQDLPDAKKEKIIAIKCYTKNCSRVPPGSATLQR
jgi:hypothetical protein